MHPRTTVVPRLLTPALTLLCAASAVAQFELPGVVTPADAFGQGGGHGKFEISVDATETVRGELFDLVVKYEIARNWYMYSPDHESPEGLGVPMSLTVPDGDVEIVGDPRIPDPKEKSVDVGTSRPEIHRVILGSGEIRYSLRAKAEAKPGPRELAVEIRYMTCEDSETGTCDPPATVPLKTLLTISEAVASDPERPETTSTDLSNAKGADAAKDVEPASDVELDDPIGGATLWRLIVLMIGGGLFALVMPCTYPMIPITISYFTKQAELRNGSVLPLALLYGVGIVVAFILVGVFVGAPILVFAASWPVNLVFGLAFLVFALSFFDIFTLRLPTALTNLGGKASTGSSGLLGVFLLGATLVITSFTCTAPVLGSLLVVVTNDESASVGRIVIAMTAFGTTMALPFVFLALFPAKVQSLPRSGEWMHSVKVFLGFLELAAAMKFFSNADLAIFGPEDFIITQEIFLISWAVILGVAALYLLNLVRLSSESTQSISGLRMMFGVVVLFLAVYFYECSRGLPMDGFTTALAPPPKESPTQARGRERGGHVRAPKIVWTKVTDDLDGGLAAAIEKKKLAFINFTGLV